MKQTITLRGKEYPCHMTMGAMRRFKRMHGIDMAAGETAAPGDMIDFMYCMVASASNEAGTPLDMDPETFADCVTAEQFASWSEALAGDGEADGEKKRAGA